MEKENQSKEKHFFEEIVKKSKTGITFPKELRDEMFQEDKDVYFRLVVPNEKDKIILEILPEEKVKELSEKIEAQKSKASKIKTNLEKKQAITKKSEVLTPNWADYFVYDFENKDKAIPILESAFYKFAETPINLEDAMGRVKYALVSFLSSKTENAKLYYAVERFLIDIIIKFDQPNLIDWIFEKIVPAIESKFLYESALLDLVELSLKTKRYEKAELYIFYVLKNIDSYSKSEMYNIMNSFKMLVKKLRKVERTEKIDILLKEKLLEYGQGVQDNDYKIQIVELLEDLNYIELAYKFAKEIQMSLPTNSMKLEEIRNLVNRLHTTPITENKQNF
jgi:predicted transcriptional regulator